MLLGREAGEKPFFETIKLSKGIQYSGQVETPDGKPASGVPFEIAPFGVDSSSSENFVDDGKGMTDSDGRFRLRMPRSQQIALYVTPHEHAPFQRFFGVDEPEKHPDSWVSGNFGRLVLAPGIRLSGRLIDLKGRPVAGQLITALSIYGQHGRTATTDAHGEFTFAPLRQGNYLIFGEGQRPGSGIDLATPSGARSGTVLQPAKIYLKNGIVPDQLVLRELATVRIEMRFVDAQGRPVRGDVVGLGGTLPQADNRPVEEQAVFASQTLSAMISGPEREDKTPNLEWGTQLMADTAGRLYINAPKGLHDVVFSTRQPDETTSIATRLGDGEPLLFFGGGQIEELKADMPNVTFVVYRSPTIRARVKTEDGETPFANVQVRASFHSSDQDHEVEFAEEVDGRFRSQRLFPDQTYEVCAVATGFVPNRILRIRLSEGMSRNVDLVLKRQPKELAIGEFAPPFIVKTVGGEALGLGDLRGKFVLLQFWGPEWDNSVQEIPRFQAVQKRIAKDGRLAMIGLCLTRDPNAAIKVIKDKELTWPQVILRDQVVDSIVLDYNAAEVPKTFLIGPDGKLLAKDIGGDQVEDVVSEALD